MNWVSTKQASHVLVLFQNVLERLGGTALLEEMCDSEIWVQHIYVRELKLGDFLLPCLSVQKNIVFNIFICITNCTKI
ncbi:rCG49370 [Rattus norvegicus]|uniref:RCG49370 n=1 Tax=Rattus norvegicus TaxID=10116 RepID=A6J2M2_RAT|nr:rCG49370 [Rattus norvegicus]